MEDIRIYTWNFELLHVENEILSSHFDIKYNAIGNAEIHFPITSEVLPIIMSHDYLVFCQGDKQMIMTGRGITTDIAVFGRSCNWLLSGRTVKPFNSVDLSCQKDVESIVRHFVSDAFSDVHNFKNSVTVGSAVCPDFEKTSIVYLSDLAAEILSIDGLGHRVVFDIANKEWKFEIYRGKIISDIIVSESERTAYDATYNTDCASAYDSGWYQYTVETEENVEQQKEWGFVDSGKRGIYRRDAILSGESESEAQADLAMKRATKTTAVKTRNLQYGFDYSVGDILQVQFEKGDFVTSSKQRVASVKLFYEHNNIGATPTFEEV